MTPKINSLKKQRESAELESIIDEFGKAMRNANKRYIDARNCSGSLIQFTLAMVSAWDKYIDFCKEHPDA